MKFTASETQFINALIAAGGAFTPPDCFRLKADDAKTARRLERKGVITIEQVDTGYRYSLRDGADG